MTPVFKQLHHVFDKKKNLKIPLIAKLYEKYNNPFIFKFISNISVVYIYNSITLLLNILSGIIIARLLGPYYLGKIGIVGNISAFMFVFFCLGLNSAMYKYLPDTSEEEFNVYASNALRITIIASLIISLICFLLHGLALEYLKIPFELWIFAAGMAVFANFFSLTESFLRGKKLYTKIGKLKLIRSIFFSVIIIILYLLLKEKNILYYFITLFISQGIYTIYVIILLKIPGWNNNFQITSKLLRYGFFITFNTMCNAVIVSSDMIILNFFYPDSEKIGIYSAYSNQAKFFFSSFFYEVFTVVFIPMIAQMDKIKIYEKLNSRIVKIFFIIFLGVFVWIAVTILLYGKKYEFNFLYIILVSIGTGFYAIFQLNNTIFNLESEKGLKMGITVLLIIMPLSLLLQIVLIKSMGIVGGMIAIVLTNLLLLITFKILFKIGYCKSINNNQRLITG